MDRQDEERGRYVIPGVGPSANPAERLRHHREPYAPAPYSGEAARALAADLRRELEGEVRFDDGSRALYATDASNYRQVPIGVVVPRSVADVVATVAVCRRHAAPVLCRGGGTSLAGQCCNVAVVIDFTKHVHRILEVDPDRRIARVEPGVVLDALRDEAERHGLTFGPDPATHNHCTIGGMLGNDSCGVHAMMAGRTADNVCRVEALTYDGLRAWFGPTPDAERDAIVRAGGRRGELYARMTALRDRVGDLVRARYPRIPRRVSGYNLDDLLPEHGFDVGRALVGSEGTLATFLQAELKLVPSPRGRALLVLGYPDVYAAADDVPRLREFGPIGLEGMDDILVEDLRKKQLHAMTLELLPDGRAWLLVEFGGEDRRDALASARRCVDGLPGRGGALDARTYDPDDEHLVWTLRESGLGATARVPGEPDTWEGWEDSAVPPERLGDYLRALRKLYDRFGYAGALYGHFGQGCVHTRTTLDLVTEEGVARYRAFAEEAADLVTSFGGSLSGEHGDGQSRGELLDRMFGPELVEAFREYKRIWDPDWKMNPGKVVDPYRLDENLRLGPGYVELRNPTRFALRGDRGSLARAAARCIGVGECRRERGGVMCPSFRVTGDEEHSTRGRAHLLHEMMMGDPIRDGWRSKAVKDALDLCLACKGCKSDCPVNVDMATYKAEFLSHHYAGRLRPPNAYALGLVMWWARAASLAPGLANALTHAPVLAPLAKRAIGLAPERDAPRFAPVTFRRWFARRGARPGADGKRVMLFTDTFTDFFEPEIGISAVEVLEGAGYRVEIPSRRICCGRPLYDYGMLDLAKRMLRQDLDVLTPAVADGVPVVVLEPSCAAVFRDELPDLLADDPRAERLARGTKLLSELVDEADRFPTPRLPREALVQVHCHQHAVLGAGAERRVLDRLGLDLRMLDAGCCGMAGSFGFEGGARYEVSVAVGEHQLLPRIRAAPENALVLADGFSCRTQIAQGAGRRALHLGEAMRLAAEPDAEVRDPAEWARARRPRRRAQDVLRESMLAGGALLALAAAAYGVWRRARGR